MLTIKQAQYELKIAVRNNPGPWEQHSFVAAENARLIAEKVPGMDPKKAYVLGLLHDIGRSVGVTGMRHVIDGYDYMMALGQPEIAGKHDCTPEQKAYIQNYLDTHEYDDYDQLIQLCDALSLPQGACLMEKRFVDVALRHGVQDYTTKRWQGYLELKKYFDSKCGCDIYTLLPGVFENSMGNLK